MHFLYIVTGIALVCSLISDRKKTYQVLKIATKKFLTILPAFLLMLILVSIILYFFPDKVISQHLSSRGEFLGVLLASFIGSITLMPGFIAYPLCGILLTEGVSYMVLSAFTTTLMMVGVLTWPIEKTYFGKTVAIVRNVISLLIALFIALITGIYFGEVL